MTRRRSNTNKLSQNGLCKLAFFGNVGGTNKCLYRCPTGVRELRIGFLGAAFCPPYILDK